MQAFPTVGRRYSYTHTVLLSDATSDGRMRFDAVARVLHDAATKDNQDSPTADKGSWILRWIALEIKALPRYLDALTVATACSATGHAWATRRTTLTTGNSVLIDAEALWINVHPTSGRPLRLSGEFLSIFGPSAEGRTVRPHLTLRVPKEPALAQLSLPLRYCDLDIMKHVNNAIHLALIEEVLHTQEVHNPALVTDLRIEFGPALVQSGGALAHLWTTQHSDHVTLSQNNVVCSQTLLNYRK